MHNIKHIDIKLGNILINKVKGELRVYITNLRIARAYKLAKESNTNLLTSFTPMYAALEVATQDVRGYSSNIFSLNCVFLEILDTLLSSSLMLRERLSILQIGNRSYSANLETVFEWCDQVRSELLKSGLTLSLSLTTGDVAY